MTTFEQGYKLGKLDQKEIDAYSHNYSYNQGLKDKEDSIIKLLKNKLSPITYEHHECVSIDDVIAAIKGGNTDNSNIHTTVDNEINGTSKSVLRRMEIQHPPESFRDKANGK
jgi:hypothetical protein